MPTLSASQIAGYARQGGFSGAEIPIAVAIALAESGGRTDATHRNSNGSIDHGLWQINDVNASVLASGNWANPLDNARMAYAIYRQQGWRAWTTYKHGTYAKFLTPGLQDAVPNPNVPAYPAGLPGPLGDIESAVKVLTNPHTWLRLATIIAGGVLLLMGLALLGWKNAPQSVKTAAKESAKAVATKGVA